MKVGKGEWKEKGSGWSLQKKIYFSHGWNLKQRSGLNVELEHSVEIACTLRAVDSGEITVPASCGPAL